MPQRLQYQELQRTPSQRRQAATGRQREPSQGRRFGAAPCQTLAKALAPPGTHAQLFIWLQINNEDLQMPFIVKKEVSSFHAHLTAAQVALWPNQPPAPAHAADGLATSTAPSSAAPQPPGEHVQCKRCICASKIGTTLNLKHRLQYKRLGRT